MKSHFSSALTICRGYIINKSEGRTLLNVCVREREREGGRGRGSILSSSVSGREKLPGDHGLPGEKGLEWTIADLKVIKWLLLKLPVKFGNRFFDPLYVIDCKYENM